VPRSSTGFAGEMLSPPFENSAASRRRARWVPRRAALEQARSREFERTPPLRSPRRASFRNRPPLLDGLASKRCPQPSVVAAARATPPWMKRLVDEERDGGTGPRLGPWLRVTGRNRLPTVQRPIPDAGMKRMPRRPPPAWLESR